MRPIKISQKTQDTNHARWMNEENEKFEKAKLGNAYDNVQLIKAKIKTKDEARRPVRRMISAFKTLATAFPTIF